MAGREVSGYDNSLNNLFDNASFICTPVDAPRRKVDALIGLAEDMGFARTVVTTPEHHDEMIACRLWHPSMQASAPAAIGM